MSSSKKPTVLSPYLTPENVALLNKIAQPLYLTSLFLVISLKFFSLWSFPYCLVGSYLVALFVRHVLLLPYAIVPHFKDVTFQNADHRYYALISGAAYGIGYGYCQKFAADNYNLILVGRNGERLEKAKKQLESTYGVKVMVVEKDLSVRGKIAESLDKEIKKKDPQAIVVHVVNNAGYGSHGEFLELDIESELNMVDLNICSLMEISHYYANQMIQWKKVEEHKFITPRISNIASIASFVPTPNGATYSATKSFVYSLSTALAQEVKHHGITVTTVCPGMIATEFFDRAKVESRILKHMVKCPVDAFVDETYPQMMTGQLYTINSGVNNFVAAYTLLLNTLVLPLNLKLTQFIYQK